MKKLITAFAIVAGLSACGSSSMETEETNNDPVSSTAVATTETTEETAAPAPKMSPEEAYINGIANDFSWVVNAMGRVELVKLGKLICQAIDEGMSFSQYLDLILAYDVDAGAGGAILRESIWNFCPNEQWFLDAAIDQLSNS